MTAPPPPAEAPPATPAEVEATTRRLLGKQGPFRATVRLLDREGRKWVAKDYRGCTPLYRWTVGRLILAREVRALTRLAGIMGIPRIEARAGTWILVMTRFKGLDLGKTPRVEQTPEFFDHLLAIVREMHARGVLHLDLRQRRNILLQPDGRPAVLDFGAAVCARPGGWRMRRFAPIDVSGVLKYKHRAQPGSLSKVEAATLARAERRRKWWPFRDWWRRDNDSANAKDGNGEYEEDTA